MRAQMGQLGERYGTGGEEVRYCCQYSIYGFQQLTGDGQLLKPAFFAVCSNGAEQRKARDADYSN
jgi:hypothetical protein